MHHLEDINLWLSFKEELPLQLLKAFDKRRDKNKYRDLFALDKNKYPCIQTLDDINTDYATNANEQKAFRQRLRRQIKSAIKAKSEEEMKSKDQTPTTPQPQIATESHNAIKQGPPQEDKTPSTPSFDVVVKSDVQAHTGSTSTLNHGSWTEQMYEQNLADFSNRIDPSLQNEGPDYDEFCLCIRSVSGIPVAPTNYYLRDYRRFMDVLCKHTAQFWVDFKFKRTVEKKDFHHSMRNLSTWFRSQSDSDNYWDRFVKTLWTNGVLCKADASELIKYPDEITEAEPTAVLPPCGPSDAGLIDLTNDQTEDDGGPGPNRRAGTANSVSAYRICQQAAAAAESFPSEQKKYLDSLDFRTDVVVGILLCHNINIPAFEKTLESNTEFRRKLRVFVQAACGV